MFSISPAFTSKRLCCCLLSGCLAFNHNPGSALKAPQSPREHLSVLLFVLLVLSLLGVVGAESILLDAGISLAILIGLLGGLSEGLVDASEGLLLLAGRILANRSMDLLHQLLDVISLNTSIQVHGEVLLVVLLIILLHLSHVVSNVLTHDTSLVDRGVVLLGVAVVAREALLGVGDVKSTVRGTLHGSEDLGTSGGVLDSNIKKGTERSLLVIDLLNEVGAAVDLGGDDLTSGLLDTSVDLIKAELLEKAAGKQQASAVSSSVVLQANSESVLGKLLGGSRAEDLVAVDLSIDDLAEDVLVGEADDQAVLVRRVLVLVLSDKLGALTVVSATLATTAELDLEGLEISLVLNNLDERLYQQTYKISHHAT